MARVLGGAILVFSSLYLVALLLFVVGHFGLFGSERTPLAGVFLVPLGLPWVLLSNRLPEWMLPWTGLLAPLIKIAGLQVFRRAFSERRSFAFAFERDCG